MGGAESRVCGGEGTSTKRSTLSKSCSRMRKDLCLADRLQTMKPTMGSQTALVPSKAFSTSRGQCREHKVQASSSTPQTPKNDS
eukprot:2295575-Amphidinium_carterae.1